MKKKNRAQVLHAEGPRASFLFQHFCSILLPYSRAFGKIFLKYFFVSAGVPWKNGTYKFNILRKKKSTNRKNLGLYVTRRALQHIKKSGGWGTLPPLNSIYTPFCKKDQKNGFYLDWLNFTSSTNFSRINHDKINKTFSDIIEILRFYCSFFLIHFFFHFYHAYIIFTSAKDKRLTIYAYFLQLCLNYLSWLFSWSDHHQHLV
jgi:hypothetical protein